MTIFLENSCWKTQTIREHSAIDRYKLLFRNQWKDKILRNIPYDQSAKQKWKRLQKQTCKKQQINPKENKTLSAVKSILTHYWGKGKLLLLLESNLVNELCGRLMRQQS